MPDIGIDDGSNFNRPWRILEIPNDSPTIPLGTVGYETLNELKENDINWHNYRTNDSKSAYKICEDRFIIKTTNKVIFLPNDYEFREDSFKILKHTVFGELDNKRIKGIHLFSNLKRGLQAIEYLKDPDKNGVWKAKITYYVIGRKKSYTKVSSMFPIDWGETKFMFEIFHAYKTKRQCSSNTEKFHSYTYSGIPVDFVIKNGRVKTVYPLHQDDK